MITVTGIVARGEIRCRRLAGALRRATLAACVAVTAGCQPPPAPEPLQPIQDWRSRVGCYQAGDWRFALDSVPAMAYWTNPPPGAWQAWTYGERARGDVYWTLTPGGYADVVEHNGLDGGTTRFMAKGDSLVGARKGWTDIITPPRPPDRVAAARIPCPGPASGDGPPPNPEQLQRTFMRGLADMLLDSLAPRYRVHMLPERPGVSRLTAVVSSIVSSHLESGSRRNPDTVYGMRLEVESDSLTRNEAVATVAISLCENRPEPMNLHVERVRYRFVRSPEGWRLVSTEPLGRTGGACGSHLPETPQP
ncbi:MAG: hypothetical protein ACJ8J0_18585 [Longimicrobiaceae bacterium]